jgi:anti-sigma factor RsiW
MNCPEENTIGMFVDGMLPKERSVELSEHIQNCSQCRKIRDEFVQINELTKSSFAVNVEQKHLDELKEKIKGSATGRRGFTPARIYNITSELFWISTQVAAMFLIACAVAFMLSTGRAPAMAAGHTEGFGPRIIPRAGVRDEKPIVDILREKDRTVAKLF